MILADLGPPVSRQFTLPVIGLRLVPKHSETFPHDALELVAGPLVQAEGEDVGHLHKIPLPCDDTFHGLRLTHNLEQAVAGIRGGEVLQAVLIQQKVTRSHKDQF